jgi:hypothetical protein
MCFWWSSAYDSSNNADSDIEEHINYSLEIVSANGGDPQSPLFE